MNYYILDVLLLMMFAFPNLIIGLSDPGFKQFCERFKGSYTKRTENVGDKCLLEFQVYTQDDKDAWQLCKFRVPYEIINAKSLPGKATCHTETGYVCNPGWYLMYGKCYKKMDREEHYDFKTAIGMCQKEGAQIAEIGKQLVPLWGTFFRYLSLIWVRGAEGQKPKHDERGLTDDEKAMALAYGTAPAYGVSYPSLIRISKKSSALVLCEYTPPITVQQSVYFAKRWSKVYPNIGFKKSYIMIRSSKHFGYARENVIDKHCEGIAQIIGIPKFRGFRAFSKSQIDEGNNELVDRLPYARGVVRKYSGKDASARKQPTCTNSDGFFDDFKMEKCGSSRNQQSDCGVPKESFLNGNHKRTCDVEQSTSVIMSSQAPYRLMPVSEAMRAPSLCISAFPSLVIRECDEGWQSFDRDGFVFCHKAFNDPKNWDDAQKACQTHDAFLSGYESHEERQFIFELGKKAGVNTQMWLGARRRAECNWGSVRNGRGYDDSAECNRNEVMEWVNGVASNSKKLFATVWNGIQNPSYWLHVEACVEILYGEKIYNPGVNADALLNDISCDTVIPYVCGKPPANLYD